MPVHVCNKVASLPAPGELREVGGSVDCTSFVADSMTRHLRTSMVWPLGPKALSCGD